MPEPTSNKRYDFQNTNVTDENGNSIMTPCNSTAGDYSQTWCCGNTRNCCEGDSDSHPIYTLATNIYSISSTSSSTSVPFVTATQNASTPTPNSASTPENKSSNLSTGEKAGVGIGVSIGAIALLAGGLVFFLRWRKSRADPRAELPASQSAVYEKPARAQDTRFELPGDSTSPVRNQTSELH